MLSLPPSATLPRCCRLPICRRLHRNPGLALGLGISLGLSLVAGSCLAQGPGSGEYHFNSQLLRGSSQGMDLVRFERGMTVSPGRYELEVFLNGEYLGREPVEVLAGRAAGGGESGGEGGGEGGADGVHVCLPRDSLLSWPLRWERLAGVTPRSEQDGCLDPVRWLPDIEVDIDLPHMTLKLGVPQAYVMAQARGFVPASAWRDGVAAGFVRYNANAYRSRRDGDSASESFYLGMNAGVNLKGWRLRHNANVTDGKGQDAHYASTNTYLQHDVTPLEATFTAGEYQTSGLGFESVPFSGIQLASDDAMLPPSQRGYAPVVRGTAHTNAKVTIHQRDTLIYETTVPPGPFVIDDLYATNVAADLVVTVTESDGDERRFIVPFASVAQLLRPGSGRFQLAAGRYRDDALDEEPAFLQAEGRYGLNNHLTLYGGAQLADDYRAVLLGGALSTSLGALALDVTLSHASAMPVTLDADADSQSESDATRVGKSYRITYSRLFQATDTHLTVAAYRFSSSDYLSFGDAARGRDEGAINGYRGHERHRFDVNLTQSVPVLGDVYVSGSSIDYWGAENGATSYQMGLSHGFSWGTLSLSAGRSESDGEFDNELYASLSLPLGGSHQLSTNSHRTGDRHDEQLRVSGQRRDLGYGAYASHSGGAGGAGATSIGANLSYDASQVRLGISASRGEDYWSGSVSASGTVIAFGQGIVLTEDQGETMAIIRAEGAKGAAVSSSSHIRLDGRGLAAVAGLTPYQFNRISLDPSAMTDTVALTMNSQRVAPRRGAIVALDYATEAGFPYLLRVQSDVPFGAEVVDSEGHVVTLLGQGGIGMVRNIDGYTRGLFLRWGEQRTPRCRLDYAVPMDSNASPQVSPQASPQAYQLLPATCRSSAGDA
ncbi:fimbria/pilus outer membrane usher protein [Halomonas sp. V046]|uniref:fimbria/pilus outer membrane usher protein n=1 Tax=Halomonas sp. V046 TaxID=3459611 RepID=UPI004044D963